jgi:allantoinase
MDNELYPYQPIIERPTLRFPNGKQLAFYIGLNIEHFRIDMPFMRPYVPDPMSHGQRDYGTRVAIWRLVDVFDELGIRASAITNSDVCTRYPQIIEAGIQRDWAWIAHGQNNSLRQSNMAPDDERVFLQEMVDAFDAALPSRPKGWLGPGLSETFATPHILRDLGFTYLLDWCADDQPFALNVPGMISVPYALEVNDLGMWMTNTLKGADYESMVMDHFEGLLAQSAETGLVMALPLHTFVVGQPRLIGYFKRCLQRICATDEVWVTTSDEIADAYFDRLASS